MNGDGRMSEVPLPRCGVPPGIPTCATVVGATVVKEATAETTAMSRACADEAALEEVHRIKIRRPEAHDEPDTMERLRMQKL